MRHGTRLHHRARRVSLNDLITAGTSVALYVIVWCMFVCLCVICVCLFVYIRRLLLCLFVCGACLYVCGVCLWCLFVCFCEHLLVSLLFPLLSFVNMSFDVLVSFLSLCTFNIVDLVMFNVNKVFPGGTALQNPRNLSESTLMLSWTTTDTRWTLISSDNILSKIRRYILTLTPCILLYL